MITAKQVAMDWADTVNGNFQINQQASRKFYNPTYADQMAVLIASQAEELEVCRGALQKLAVLGNEPFEGNSVGNVIAQQALNWRSDNNALLLNK